MSTVHAPVTAPNSVPAWNRPRTPPPHLRASAIPTKPSANREGSLTCDDAVISSVPASRFPRGAQLAH
ncbi:Uncharacterised protein [Mycobacteroides abscessus subsp. abscessus]|nr:Uncharacterised protein [Mycobacteroides abscessus subsp. abscessus]SKY57356.1 Uncharacterised protein [Mycobacteroides abscessus subsp. abscessus]